MSIASSPLHFLSICLTLAVSQGLTGPAQSQDSFVRIPLGSGRHGAERLTAVALPKTTAAAAAIAPSTAGGATGTRLAFQKSGGERRIVALQGRPSGSLSEKMALELRFRLAIEQGTPPDLAIVIHQRDGGLWYRVVAAGPPAGQATDLRMPLSKSFARAMFSAGGQETVDWSQVDRVWVALLIDGPARGTFDLLRAVFTDEPFRPDSPLAVRGDWNSTHDPAVKDRIAMETTGPGGGPSISYTFTMPGGRHMYAIPRVPVQVEELEGYSALRFTYRTELPEGINGLLVMLMEADGTQYIAEPAPAGASDWTTATIRFDQFQRGGWSKDENDRLDLNEVRHVAIGVHGTAKPQAASGKIEMAGVEFAP